MTDLKRSDPSLHYTVQGAGPAVVLLPGLLSDSASWGPLVPQLANHHHVICPDPRHTGRSQADSSPVTIDTLCADIIALVDRLALPSFSLVGHSFGAILAHHVAERMPERVTHLLCMAAAPSPDTRLAIIFQTLVEVRATAGDDLWLHALFPWLFHREAFAAPDALAAMTEASRAYPYAQSLPAMRAQIATFQTAIDQPTPNPTAVATTAILAEDDALIPAIPAEAAWRARNVPVHRIAQAGHALHWDQPEATAALVLRLLAG